MTRISFNGFLVCIAVSTKCTLYRYSLNGLVNNAKFPTCQYLILKNVIHSGMVFFSVKSVTSKWIAQNRYRYQVHTVLDIRRELMQNSTLAVETWGHLLSYFCISVRSTTEPAYCMCQCHCMCQCLSHTRVSSVLHVKMENFWSNLVKVLYTVLLFQ